MTIIFINTEYIVQEDSHIAHLDFNKELNQQLFGVFDGHGGGEVAQYTRQHYADCLRSMKKYQDKSFGEALRESFLKIDEELEGAQGQEELQAFKKLNPPNKSPLFKILGETLGNGAGGEIGRAHV